MAWENMSLSEVLRELREQKNMSLRQVEKKSGVSNAYLSQLETGKIQQPSPHILHKLAEVYNTSYNDLLKVAGYIKQKGKKASKNLMEGIALSALEDLTDEEKEQVLEYIKFLKSKRRKA
jgi:transcriptional regulator with XRE-family HTH domain